MGKRRKAIRWLAAIVIVALIGGVTAVAVDRRIREQVEEEYLNRVAEMVNLNGWYRKALSITGEAKYSWDGIEYPEGMYIDKKSIYTQILEIRLFVPEYVIDYTSVDQLLEEYDSFCNTGRNSKILDEFHKGCEMAAAQISEKEIQFDDIVSMMAWLGKGKLKIENGEMIEDKEAGEGIYLSDFSDEELMELCRMFEDNRDVIIDYMMEKGKLKEMEKNEKG